MDKRGMAEAELKERVVSLETALTHANSLAHALTSQVTHHPHSLFKVTHAHPVTGQEAITDSLLM